MEIIQNEMTSGIYCYKDTLKDNTIVYVGKDSHIDENRRKKEHMYPSKYDEQVINRILQNNPNRYSYHVLKQGDFNENLLNALEIIYTHRYKPKFSFTIGGDGVRGHKLSDAHKKKLSENHADFSGENNPFYGRTHTKESKLKMSSAKKGKPLSEATRKKLSESLKGRVFSDETRRKLSLAQKGRKLSDEHRENMIKSKNSTGFFRVYKRKQKDCTQGFRWVYQYPNELGKISQISSVDLNKLKEKVLNNGLEWREF